MILLNSGIIAIVLYCIVLILLLSGWREIWCSTVTAHGSALFMASLACAVWFNIEFTASFHMNAGIWILIIGACVSLSRIHPWYRKGYTLTIALLVGIVYALFAHLVIMDPIFIWLSPIWDPIIVSTFCILVAVQRFDEQFFIVTAALLIADVLSQWLTTDVPTIQVGAAIWYDQWWMMIVAVRLAAWCSELAIQGIRTTYGMVNKRMGRRK